MIECISKRSPLCAGVGNTVWQGMCSNCADEQGRTKKIQELDAVQRARKDDYEERLEFVREHTNTFERHTWEID